MKVKLLKLEQKLNRFPPCVCRMLARTGNSNRNMRLMEDREIARDSGLHIARVRAFSWLVSWDGVAVDEMIAFSRACGIDFDDGKNLAKHYRYLKLTRPFYYLRNHADWKSIWSKIFQSYAEELERRMQDGLRTQEK